MDTLPVPDIAIVQLVNEIHNGVPISVDCELTPYEYKPLTRPGEIRVLRLYPQAPNLRGLRTVVPNCDISHVVMGTAPYLAVSYTWGRMDTWRFLPLRGNKFVTVTQSLYSLICQLCPKEEVMLRVWADQVCIYQRDLAERAAQVQMMSDIYERAGGMSIWLGDADDTVEAAVNLINRLNCDDLPLHRVTQLQAKSNIAELAQILQRNGIEVGDAEPGWRGLENLSRREWFSRLWVFQEAVVVTDKFAFVCGPYDFDLPRVYRAFMLASRLCNLGPSGWMTVYIVMLHRIKYHASRPHLMDLLRDTSNSTFNCTEPRDRVYALISLQSRDDPCPISVDYTLPVSTVYEDAANAITINKKALDILYRPRGNPLPSHPSWVPTWTSDMFDEAINDDPPQTSFRCSNGLEHTFENTDPGRLLTKGMVVARITKVMDHIFPPFRRDYDGLKAYIGTTTLVPALLSKLRDHSVCAGISAREREGHVNWLLSTTLSRGFYRARDPTDFVTTTTLGSEEPTTTEEPTTIEKLPDSGEPASTDLAAILLAGDPFGVFMMCKCAATRRVALLDAPGFPLALVSDVAEVGDLVCVLHGANVPIVLREMGGGRYGFVGDCYVHGIMYGEAVTWSQDEGDVFELV